MCAKGLGETYTTLDRRSLLLLYMLLFLLLLSLIINKAEQAGNFKVFDNFNAEKIQRRKYYVGESAHSSLHHTGILVQI